MSFCNYTFCDYIVLRFFSLFAGCFPVKEFKQEYKRTTVRCNREREREYELEREHELERERARAREVNIVNSEPKKKPLFNANKKEENYFEFEIIEDLP